MKNRVSTKVCQRNGAMLSPKFSMLLPFALLPGLMLGNLYHPNAAWALNPTSNRWIAQVQAQELPILGVVQSPDNLATWADITARLAATGLPYRIIDWSKVQHSGGFGDITVLFMPNVETITAEQLLGLQAWLNRGGRLIVSGAVGRQSSVGVQNALRSLLGAYWANDLSQPQTLQPLKNPNQPWIQSADTSSTVIGGVLASINLSSQPVAIWQADQPAVTVTENSTFLGWRWGDPKTSLASLDSSWLRAAVSRFQTRQPASSPRSISPSAVVSPAEAQAASVEQRPIPPSRANSNSFSQSPQPVSIAGTASRLNADDPAEQVAASDFDPDSTRITLYEATTMRQELENLIGRYESALILAGSRHSPRASLKAEGTANIASTATPIDNAVLTEARQRYAAFSEALTQRDYATARQQWLTTRQLLWQHFPLDQPLSQPEVRAIWLDRGTIVQAGSRRGLEQIFDRLAAAGINTVFFETVNAGYAIYPSQVASQNPLTQGWDPLADAVELAHQRGIELHAWVWTFAAGNQAHNRILGQPASFPGPVLAVHPNWANYDSRGHLIPPGQKKPFLDPANPEVRSYLLNLFQEIVSRYSVDGLQLDYIRYPFQDPRLGGHTYGYGMAARQQFSQQTGVDPLTLTPDSSPLWQHWTEFRTEQVSSFVADVSKLVHRLKPNLILSTAVFALPEQQRLNEIQQNWEIWAQRGDVDMIVLMSYASDTNGLQRLASPWLSSNAKLGSTLILPGIRLLNLSDETVVDQIQSLRDSSSGGFALFAAENLNRRLQSIFHQTQGETTPSTEPVPYRQPFAAAASRYEVLLQQWNWLLENNQIQVQQPETWRSKTTALEQSLQTLAQTPSQQNLQQTQQLLSSFQNQFRGWITLPTLSADYRMQTWQHQLETINRLIHYGERVVLGRQNGSETAEVNKPLTQSTTQNFQQR